MDIALIIIDMQKAYFSENSKKSMESAVGYINSIIEIFRKHEKQVIWTKNTIKNDKNIMDTIDFEIIDLLKPQNHDKVIIKAYDNAFNKTDLYEYLAENKIDTIIITGFCAEYCVLSTYRGAKDKDITPILLKNAIASTNKDNIKFVEEISDIITIRALEKIMKMI